MLDLRNPSVARREPRAAVRALLFGVATLAASGVLAPMASGCSSSDSAATTTGKRVTLHTRVQAAPEIQTTFTTGVGWNVKLSKAAVAFASLYYFDGEPAFVQRSLPRRRTPGPEWFFGLREAHAHPGHYQAGNAMGQMLAPSSFDLFGPAAALADGDGVSGVYRSARFVFAETASGPAQAALGGHVAVAEGVATKADDASADPIYFRVSADFADVAKSVTQGEVDGCVFEEKDVESDGTVTLTLKPSVWFNLVDFSKVAPGTAAAPTEIPHGDVAQIGFALGLVQLTAYGFAFSN